MHKKPLCLLLGKSPFLVALADQLAVLELVYWRVQAADLPTYSYQRFPEQSLLLYPQQPSAENQAFLFSLLSQFEPELQPIVFAETNPFLAAYLARYRQAPLYLRSELLLSLNAAERDWILETPTLNALFSNKFVLAPARPAPQDEFIAMTSFSCFSEAEIMSDLGAWLKREFSDFH